MEFWIEMTNESFHYIDKYAFEAIVVKHNSTKGGNDSI